MTGYVAICHGLRGKTLGICLQPGMPVFSEFVLEAFVCLNAAVKASDTRTDNKIEHKLTDRPINVVARKRVRIHGDGHLQANSALQGSSCISSNRAPPECLNAHDPSWRIRTNLKVRDFRISCSLTPES